MHNAQKINSTKKTEGEIGGNGMMKMLFIIFIAIIIVIPIVCDGENKENTKGDDNSNTPTTSYKEVLELRFDGYTPCNPAIDYKFELDTQGDPISIKFPGVNTLVHYSGKGTIKVPPRNFGQVKILSQNPKKQVRVRIWEVIKIKKITSR